jgi:hypothetical protein
MDPGQPPGEEKEAEVDYIDVTDTVWRHFYEDDPEQIEAFNEGDKKFKSRKRSALRTILKTPPSHFESFFHLNVSEYDNATFAQKFMWHLKRKKDIKETHSRKPIAAPEEYLEEYSQNAWDALPLEEKRTIKKKYSRKKSREARGGRERGPSAERQPSDDATESTLPEIQPQEDDSTTSTPSKLGRRSSEKLKLHTMMQHCAKFNEQFEIINDKSGLVTFAMLVYVNEVKEVGQYGGRPSNDLLKRPKREIVVVSPNLTRARFTSKLVYQGITPVQDSPFDQDNEITFLHNEADVDGFVSTYKESRRRTTATAAASATHQAESVAAVVDNWPPAGRSLTTPTDQQQGVL